MRALPKSFYPRVLALLSFYLVMTTLYISDYQVEYKTVDVMKERATAQGEYIRKLMINIKGLK